MRLVVTIALFALVACGGTESGTPTGETAAETPAVAAEGSGGAPEPAAEEAPATDPKVASCLELVAAGEFQQAVEPCKAALAADPGNAEVKSALAEAQSRSAAMAEAAAAEEAAQGAGGEAASKLDEATGGMKVGQ